MREPSEEISNPHNLWVDSSNLSNRDQTSYLGLMRYFYNLKTQSYFKKMALGPTACVEAVDAYLAVQRHYVWAYSDVTKDFELGHQLFTFGGDVKDVYGFLENGQDMLVAVRSGSPTLLVMDVAGYLYGDDFSDMLIAIGSLKYVVNRVSHHYSQKYPGLYVADTKDSFLK